MTAFLSRTNSLRAAAFVHAGRPLAVLICTLLAPAALLCQEASPPHELAAQVNALNAALIAGVSAKPDPARLADVLQVRAALLSQLLAADPAMAAELALPTDIAQRLRASAPADTLETGGEWTGTLTAVVADDFVHQRSRTHCVLSTPERIYDVVSPALPQTRSGAQVRVGGVALAGRIFVQDIADAAPASATVPRCTTTGPQSIAVLMLTTPSSTTFPPGYTKAALQDAFFGSPTDTSATQSLNGFWTEMSYGLASAVGQVLGPFALSKDYTWSTQNQMVTDAVNALDATVDFSQFTRLALIFPVQSNDDWGGAAGDSTLGCLTISSPSKGTLPASISWLPAFPNGSPPSGLYAHEMGHGLGLNHSSTDDYGPIPLGPLATAGVTVEYGDPFSLMGYPYFSGGTSGHYVAQHKSLLLHWLSPGDYAEVSAAGTYTLAPYETGSGLRALRVLRDAATGAWLWVEYRQPIGDVDSNLQKRTPTNVFDGALIRYEDPNLDSPWHSYLLDFEPASTPNAFATAALTPGKSWSDLYSPLSLTVNSATPQGLSITVGYRSVTPKSQKITFWALAGRALGAAPFPISATASSGLPVSFNSQTIPICTVLGSQVTVAAVGTCTVRATQPGNFTYLAAAPVSQSFQVMQRGTPMPGISSLSPASVVAGGAPFTLTVNGSGFLSGAVVKWNTTTLRTSFVSTMQLTASVPAGLIASPGAAAIAVANPGGATSNALAFRCREPRRTRPSHSR